jgi:hypothetical protein
MDIKIFPITKNPHESFIKTLKLNYKDINHPNHKL